MLGKLLRQADGLKLLMLLEQLEERIVLDGAVDDVSCRTDLFSAQSVDTDSVADSQASDAVSTDTPMGVESLALETGSETLPDGTWHYWQTDWDGATGNGYEFHSWQDGSSSFHQVQWDSATNSKGTHNGFDYNLQRDGSWTYEAVQWDVSQNGYSYDATSTGTYTYETEQWSDGMGYSYTSNSDNQWTYHIRQPGTAVGDVLEYEADSTGFYDFTYTWANGYTWQDTNNHLPQAVAFSAKGHQDTTFSVSFWNLYDEDQGDTISSVTVTYLPSYGVLKLNEALVVQGQVISGQDLEHVVFTPEVGWNGYTYLYYKVTDSHGGTSVYSSTGRIQVDVPSATPNSAGPGALTNVDGTLYFTADEGIHGKELWKSSGSDATTVLVKDIYKGSDASYPSYLTEMNGIVYFAANDGVHGQELWKSDGTAAGTVMVKDIFVGSASTPQYLTNVNGTLFFVASDGVHGQELWKSDGTEAGTVMVQDINPGSASSSPYNLTTMNGTLFFTADDGTHGEELWKSDSSGAVLVEDIRVGTGSSNVSLLTSANNTLYFTANDLVHGKELWKTTGAGATMVRDLHPGAEDTWFDRLQNVDGTLFFQTSDAHIWKSDGTESGTVEVGYETIPTSTSSPWAFMSLNGKLYFLEEDETGYSLWKSDGSTIDLVTIMTTSEPPETYRSFFYGTLNGNMWIAFDCGDTVREVWKSDGSGAVRIGTVENHSAMQWEIEMEDVNGTVYFNADDGVHGTELWKVQGGGLELVKDIYV